ncbi:MAG: BamA/TamA family outer membrane protein [bacterium]
MAAFAVAIGTLMLSAPAGRAQSQGIVIKYIEVEGEKNIPATTIIDLLTIKAGDFIGTNALTVLERNADILEKTGWFRSRPILSYEGYEDGAVLVIEVEEWPLFREIRFTGNTLFTAAELQAVIDGISSRPLKKSEAKKEKPSGAEIAPDESAEETGEPGDEEAAPAETAESAVELPEAPAAPADDERWGGNPPLVPGQVISMRTLEWVLVSVILDHYQDKGYIAAWVRDFNVGLEGEEEGIVTVDLGEGYVDEILVSGFKRTKERIIRREIRAVKVGEPLTRDAVTEDFRRLTNTGLFEQVRPDWEPSIKPGYIKMKFEVTEANTGQFGFGAGYSTVSGLQGTISYKENNLFGEAKNVSSTVIFSQDDPGFQVEYQDPNVQSRDISFSARVFSLHTRQQRNPGSVKESELKLDTWGGSVGIGKRFTEKLSGSLSFSVTENAFDVIKGDPFSGYSDVRRSRLMQEGQTRSVTVAGYYDTRDNKFSTKDGDYLALSAEIAGFGGDFDFRKYIQEYRRFFPIGDDKRHTIGVRERIGFADGQLPLYEEFRMGGAYSIRGLEEDAITGSKSVLFNTELRYAIDKDEQFVLALFSDMGWAGESFDDMDGERSAGVGIHFQLPQLGFGAIRLDYGWQIGGENAELLHFGIGEMF